MIKTSIAAVICAALLIWASEIRIQNKKTIRNLKNYKTSVYPAVYKIRSVITSCKTVEQLDNATEWGIKVIKNRKSYADESYWISTIETLSRKVKCQIS